MRTTTLIGLLLVGLKLTHVIAWSWWWVLLPFYGGAVVWLLVLGGGFLWFMKQQAENDKIRDENIPPWK